MFTRWFLVACTALVIHGSKLIAADSAVPVGSTNSMLRVATFDIDATPPVGSLMAYDPVTNVWELGLRARGIVLMGAGEPMVLCAVDWIGIANEGYDAFREALARAAGTSPQRVTVHALHQHDAPECDFTAEQILKEAGLSARQFEGGWQRQVISNLAAAVEKSLPLAHPITHLGLGEAPVERVASNRRIRGADGKVRVTRYTATRDAAVRAEPEGVIDPILSLVSFWNSERPIAVLSYYAVHPQSYYRTGIPSPDFPGLARFFRQLSVPAALHIHFNGAGGNLGAGKYNDGSPENRLVLAERLADGMRRAWESTERTAVTARDVKWATEPVALPLAKHLSVATLEEQLKEGARPFVAGNGATRLAWARRRAAGHRIELACLTLGRARILHLPGELFVEYQIAAKAARPDLFVAMAAYGDYSPWYIGTAVAYEEGGYETSASASNVAPESEEILLAAIRKLLRADELLFYDEFNGQLKDGWSWVRENKSGWRMGRGALEIRVEPGNMWGPANDAKNVLVRELPQSDTPLEISVTVSNQPTEQYEQVDLVWYYDDSHQVKIGQERVDGKLTIVMGREEKDRTRTLAIIPIEALTVELRLIADGKTIRGAFRPAGAEEWREAGSCDLPVRGLPKLALECYQGPAQTERWARISNVRVRESE